VNDVLDFSKIEAGQIDLFNAPLSVRALIEDTVAIVQAVADAKAIAINVSVSEDLPKRLQAMKRGCVRCS
jgi:signal transduction histidine kinase